MKLKKKFGQAIFQWFAGSTLTEELDTLKVNYGQGRPFVVGNYP